MSNQRILLTFSSMLLLAQGLQAQRQELEAPRELMNLIRAEKFDITLPQVMREHGVDMWIHAKGGDDPLNFEFGDSPGVYIFTDRGGDRIERALFGGRGDTELYDILAPRSDISEFVAERDPLQV